MSLTLADETVGGGISHTGGLTLPSAQTVQLSALLTHSLHLSAQVGQWAWLATS
jgi:hypothetical protein